MKQWMKRILSLTLSLLTLSMLVSVSATDSMNVLLQFAGICAVDVLLYLYTRIERNHALVPAKAEQADECEWKNTREMADSFALTAREKEVVALLLAGDSQKMIAAKLDISPSTVSFHTRNLYRKLAIQSKGQLFSLLLTAKILDAA